MVFTNFQTHLFGPAGKGFNGSQNQPLRVGAGGRVEKQTLVGAVDAGFLDILLRQAFEAFGEGALIEQLQNFVPMGIPDQFLCRRSWQFGVGRL